MSKERYNQIKDEAYKNYVKSFFKGELKKNYEGGGYDIDDYYYAIIDAQHLLGWPQDGPVSKKEFINKCKTDTEFSEKWGIQIEERELTDKERLNTLIQNDQRLIYEKVQSFKNLKRKTIKSCLDEKNIPTRIITITYNNKIIETYE
jgi:hypothetical protein